MNAAIATIAIAGAAYLIFRASSADAAIDPGAVLVAPDGAPPRKLTPSEALAIVNQVNAAMGNWHDPLDVLATIKIESNFDPTAYRFESSLGVASYGLMQVLETTARDMGFAGDVTQLYDPATNIEVGMRYMRWTWDFLAGRFGRDPTMGEWVSAYNIGVGNVLKGQLALTYASRFDSAKRNFEVA